jgi:hypothetical protein
MRNFVFIAALASCIALGAFSTAAFAQQPQRKACCMKLNGQWRDTRNGFRCFGVDANTFYACVQGKR